jgi:hypothetical protein
MYLEDTGVLTMRIGATLAPAHIEHFESAAGNLQGQERLAFENALKGYEHNSRSAGLVYYINFLGFLEDLQSFMQFGYNAAAQLTTIENAMELAKTVH